MERREDSFYTAYSYGDKLEEGHKLTLEHHISFDQRHADLSALTWMPLDRLQALRNKSVETRKRPCSATCRRPPNTGRSRRRRP